MRSGVIVRRLPASSRTGLPPNQRRRCGSSGPLQIGQNADRLALLARDLAHHGDQRRLLLVGAVRKVQPRHVQAGLHQLAEDLLRTGGGPQCCYDLCPPRHAAQNSSPFDASIATHTRPTARLADPLRPCRLSRGHSTRPSVWPPAGPVPKPGQMLLTARVRVRPTHLRIELGAHQYAQRDDVEPDHQGDRRAQRSIDTAVVRKTA